MLTRLARFVVLLSLCACAPPPAPAAPTVTAIVPPAIASPVSAVSTLPFTLGALTPASFPSAALGRELRYLVYLPAGYETSGLRYPVLYLLHGRGDDMWSWEHVRPDLDELIGAGQLPPLIAILPDADSSQRASYYVDSDHARGELVETALVHELIPHVDTAYRTLNDRAARALAGYSMGGYGALRYVLAYPQLFSAALVLSPAVYTPLPPADSSAREFGAFGRGSALFDPDIYQAKNYPALLASFAGQNLAIQLFLAVGDDEYKHPAPADAAHDLDLETHLLFNRVAREPNITAELRVLDGGHDWDVWVPAFREGTPMIFRTLRPPE